MSYGICRAAILPGVDLRAVRALLRRERKARKWSLDRLAEEAGVNRTTIQEIEKNEHGKPQLATITKLIEAMPPLTVSSFFSAIERGARHETRREDSTTQPGGRPRDHAVSAASPESIDMDLELGRTVVRIVQRELARGQVPGTGTGGAGSRPPHRKNR